MGKGIQVKCTDGWAWVADRYYQTHGEFVQTTTNPDAIAPADQLDWFTRHDVVNHYRLAEIK